MTLFLRGRELISRWPETPFAYANYYWCLNPLATAELASPNSAADHTLDTLTLRNEERAKMENGEPDFRVHADRRPSVRSSMSVGIVFCRSLAQLLTLFPCSHKTTSFLIDFRVSFRPPFLPISILTLIRLLVFQPSSRPTASFGIWSTVCPSRRWQR